MKQRIQQMPAVTEAPASQSNAVSEQAATGGLRNLIVDSAQAVAQRRLMAAVNQSPRMTAQRMRNMALSGSPMQHREAPVAGGPVVQRMIRVNGRDDLRGQNSIRIWMLQHLDREDFPGLGIMKSYAPAIRALLADAEHGIRVTDDDEGALQLFEYLLDYRYAQPNAGDHGDPNMVWRRRLVAEILRPSYPLRIVYSLHQQHLNTAGLTAALNDDVAETTAQVMAQPDFRNRGGMTIDEGWKRRRGYIIGDLATRFYRHVAGILGPAPDARVAVASAWAATNNEVLIDLGSRLKIEPRAGAAEDVTSEGLNLDDYADGSSGDPIPLIFYKSPTQYPARIEPKASSDKPQLDRDQVNDFELYDGSHVQLGGAGIFNPIQTGREIQDSQGHGSTRPVERKIRASLVMDYKLANLDIDHILDLGFCGDDAADNLWPLNQNINRRPVTGQWRTQYKLYFKAGDKLFKGAIGSPGLYHKHYRIKGFIAGTGASGIPPESGTPAAGKKT